jgi:CubicO group peptidase (beta-lactamase class C family)
MGATMHAQDIRTALSPRIDSLFAMFTDQTPGCGAVLSRAGEVLHLAAYGLANLEYRIPNTDRTVFESGSVAKQFTAAAVLALVQDGRLSLDDDVRKFIPELPRYPQGPITVRHLMHQTSGLRDQWALLIPAGRGPGTQVHTLATVVDLASRQHALNFAPGSEYYYSNTNYTLMAVLVERVSGRSMQDYSVERLFGPAGMPDTRWRDDHTTIVPGRATAYGRNATGYFTDMPFTNVIGNGGLLTTLRDMAAWHRFLDAPPATHAAIVRGLHETGRLASGKPTGYDGGLMRADYRGVAEVGHSGNTAGYRTYAARYPAHGVAAAVFCNSSAHNATLLLHQMVDLVLPVHDAVPVQRAAVTLDEAAQRRWLGRYRNPITDQAFTVVASHDTLRLNSAAGSRLVTVSPTAAFVGNTQYLLHPGASRAVILVVSGSDSVRWEPVAESLTGEPALRQYAGKFRSDEIEVEFEVAVRHGALVIVRRPADTLHLAPHYRDAFSTPSFGTVRFLRNRQGVVDALELYSLGGRARRVRLDRVTR